jgi:hypothetical protein
MGRNPRERASAFRRLSAASLGLLFAALAGCLPAARAGECGAALRHRLDASQRDVLVALHRYATGNADFEPVLDAERRADRLEARLKQACRD